MSSWPCPLSHRSQQPYPTTCPASLIANASLWPWPESPRSVIVPSAHTKPCTSPEAVWLLPATWPALLMSLAALLAPPNVPRSVVAPLCQTQAWAPHLPAMRPALLISATSIPPRSVITPSDQRSQRKVLVKLMPTTWPASFIASAWPAGPGEPRSVTGTPVLDRSELAVARDGFPVVAGLGRTVEGSGSTRSHAASARHTATTSGKTRIRPPPGRHSHETATLQNAAMRVPGRATPRCAERARASDHSPC